MTEIQLNLVELKKLDLSFPYVSKDEIMNCFNIKSTTYDKYRNKFKEKIDEKFYPSGCYLKVGQEQFNVYAWLHFASNYDYFKDKRLEKYVLPFNKQTVQEFKNIGVG